jgi:single-strand DNA-binding protein
MLNRVVLEGNLTKDPVLRETKSGKSVTNLRMAINRTFKDGEGKPKQEVCYVSVVAWNGQATFAGKYLKKGSKVSVDGRLQSRSYEKNGVKHEVIEVVAESLQSSRPNSAPPTVTPSPDQE